MVTSTTLLKELKKLRGVLGEWSGSEYVYVFSIPGIECVILFSSLSPMLIRIPPRMMINLMLANKELYNFCVHKKITSANHQATDYDITKSYQIFTFPF